MNNKNPAIKIAILGFGREGQSVLRFLKARGFARIATRINTDKYPRASASHLRQSAVRHGSPQAEREIWILDKNPKSVSGIGYRVSGTRSGKDYLKNLADFDLIFRSPGVPYNLPELRRARRSGVQFSSATKLFFQEITHLKPHTSNLTPRIIGITGTKGKGTTSTLLYNILKAHRQSSGQAAGKSVFLAGNIGKPALDILSGDNQRKSAYVILELSSFQLQDLKISPRIAVVLDVFPDHQDNHLNLKEYYEAKTNVARFQHPDGKTFFFRDSRLSKQVANHGRGKKIGVDPRRFTMFKPHDLKMPGYHNFKNAVMAATVAQSLGIPRKVILKTVKNFRGLEHRLELVRTIMVRQAHHKNKSTIYFYNDSASTNPHTTAAAIRAFPSQPKILIAGGQDKGLNYKPLAEALKNSDTNLVVLFGENKNKIKRQVANSGIRIVTCENLRVAIKIAYRFAKNLPPTAHYLLPTVVLFSPGAASFDMFKNYADRGRQFKKLVRNLT